MHRRASHKGGKIMTLTDEEREKLRKAMHAGFIAVVSGIIGALSGSSGE